jgi:hypothetical protein
MIGKIVNTLIAAILASSPLILSAAEESGPVPRMADGKPDLSGVWWTGGDLGSAGYGSTTDRSAGLQYNLYTDLYTAEAKARMATLSDKDDPTLLCKSTAFGTLSVRLFDVGTLGQIIATPEMMVFLQETFHGYQLIPTDGREHRDYLPPSYRGDAVGHWEGDTFVVETKNFTDDTWMFAEGGVSFHSEQMRVVERYNMVNANTMTIDATVHDPEVLTQPWVVPTKTVVKAPFDQLLPLVCASTETAEIMSNAQSGN